MFELSLAEIAVIVIVALLVLGPRDFIVITRKTGTIIAKIKKEIQEITQTIGQITEDGELPKTQAAAFPKPKTSLIQDLEGNWREAYDVSNIIPKIKEDIPHSP
ncbi:MAG: twin-arginine translocase TatA/TatE family subunit [Rectinemataceae bacterium]|nr:twin-arginine translocase TatA/TatE family subunit [Rectinemataceae bacterium]